MLSIYSGRGAEYERKAKDLLFGVANSRKARYYGLAGLVAFWVFRDVRQQSPARWIVVALFPAVSGIALIALGAYAMTTFDAITDIVGIGGLLAGIVFFRPRRFALAN